MSRTHPLHEDNSISTGLPESNTSQNDQPSSSNSILGETEEDEPVPIPPLFSRLQSALHPCAYGEKPTFLPDDKISEVITAEHVENYLLNCGDERLRAASARVTEYVCGSEQTRSCRIFALLLIIEEPHLILDVMAARISDYHLPLLSVNDGTKENRLVQKVDTAKSVIKQFDKWGFVRRFAFLNNQWRVMLPVFTKGRQVLRDHPVHQLEREAILPWIDYERIYNGNSEVVRVKIHHAHHKFVAEENQSFALKSLKSQTRGEFLLEVRALLKVKRRKHLEANLLTTFEQEQRYNLIFRWADGGNLHDLWGKHHPRPAMNFMWILWLAEQCYGLADALDGIHNTTMTAREVEAVQNERDSPAEIQNDNQPMREDDGKDYGRHGDIKPQNILWFKQDKNPYSRGILKISDFGLTTFHRAVTTTVTPLHVRVTHTYAAPEHGALDTLSRPFDIWSLGCIFLEFVTWILCGSDGLNEFNDKRSAEHGALNSKFSLDNFYMLKQIGERREAEIKPSVKKWIQSLKEKKECGPFLSEFLEYIRTSMLLVDKKKRDPSRVVSQQLKKMFERCKKERSYALYQGAEENIQMGESSSSHVVAAADGTGVATGLDDIALADNNRSDRAGRKRGVPGDVVSDTQRDSPRETKRTRLS
ncbi:kinase-like domain-containing protein [Biscogniauxia sp. FL1348]|nr:kinase-like domain-containing protein [Biscogniauxia sp. FL1348]